MTSLFGLALPIARVNLLRQHPHVMKGVRFPYASDLILKLLRQPVVEVVPEGTFTITAVDSEKSPPVLLILNQVRLKNRW